MDPHYSNAHSVWTDATRIIMRIVGLVCDRPLGFLSWLLSRLYTIPCGYVNILTEVVEVVNLLHNICASETQNC